MSHLSDIQEVLGNGSAIPKLISIRINFIKWLILKYNETDVRIDADAEFALFSKSINNN
jgi:hypothetical protein